MTKAKFDNPRPCCNFQFSKSGVSRELERVVATLLLFFLGLAPTVLATSVTIKVEDGSGAGLPNELVIVQDLDHGEHELLRALSDKQGNLPSFQLATGLYRLIATAPYGVWQTSVREFIVKEKSVDVVVMVQPRGKHGHGDIVTASTRVQLSEASVLVRDRYATLYLERRYKTDAKGSATIELVADPTVAVVVYGDIVSTTELMQLDLNPIIRLHNH